MGNRDDHRLDNVECGTPPGLELLFEGRAELADVIEIGQLATGRRLIVAFAPGGRIDGPRMHGELLPGSLLMELVRADGCVESESLFFFEMDDGHRIFARSKGLLSISPDVAQGLAEGQPFDPTSPYQRSFVRFEAATDGPYDWLNRGLYIGMPMRTAQVTRTSVWQIL